MSRIGPAFGPHAFPAYAVITDVDPREPVILHARSRDRARVICVRSMIDAGFADDWRDALSKIRSIFRVPLADGSELGCRKAPGEGFSSASPACARRFS